MNKRPFILTIASIVAVIVALTWIYWPKEPKPRTPKARGNEEAAPQSMRTAGSTPSAPIAEPTPSKVEVEGRKKQQLTASFLTPIAVYGRVIDAEGKPLANATVEIGINDRPFQTGSKYTITSDAEGRFSLTGVRGIAFSVRASKDGYYSSDESRAHRNVLNPSNQDVAQPSENNPVLLILRKRGAAEPLVAITSRQIDVPRNGQAIDVDLASGQVGRGSLKIESWIGDSSQRRYDWRYRLSVPGGGLSERQDRFGFEAPQKGYTEAVEINMPANVESWSSRVERDYFASLPDGSFARFGIRFYPGKRNFVVIEGYFNPKPGSRNLEYDPSKQASAR